MAQTDNFDKSYDPTPKKLEDARSKGDVPKSVDLQTSAAYGGMAIALMLFGSSIIVELGSVLMAFLAQPVEIAAVFFQDEAIASMMGGLFIDTARPLMPIFFLPTGLVIAVILAQRAFVFAPQKLYFKLSRISIIQNAKQKFGLAGLFEFAKSTVKLFIYSFCLAVFLYVYLPEIIVSAKSEVAVVLSLLGALISQFLLVVVAVSVCIGGVDVLFQQSEHIRKNRMSRKEIMDELKESEGDPYLKEERRSRAQAIASSQMMSKVPNADVVIVNPTHYAVALAWDRTPGSAPRCIAKGVDAIALKIREIAQESAVPIHSDPVTARALHASVELDEEISEDYYQAVAAAIRFADGIRQKAKARGV